MFHVALFEPEIPHNTGNIIRLCANTGCILHLIGPLGFELSDKSLKRAGLDYHSLTKIITYSKWENFESEMKSFQWIVFSTKGNKNYDTMRYTPNSVLIFGPETRGLPAEIVNTFNDCQQTARIPMTKNSRSINLSNAVAIAVYEAWRQNNFNHDHGSSAHLQHP
ncbi:MULTISPECIES: tRNA (cytidine(34)-2'-O)-methyltransferase [Candidatus Ichthyocystis]|uniref:tRNA (cytidine(34)-2'-O)-methyltransferase n=1 Tax=Candidatus Ichthyocystis hellenicum TaxID=1561003 RepID=A0A0S4M6X0_9BURK|nr:MULTISPECIES: tRNA (cytidine(34)-2'-O)-methyltransferase [Ichthyocystis]CUT17140.1 tRNA (cytidine(34)-2'-O)-methyltransferase [Candidatus Ichthyocystis hellenicum]